MDILALLKAERDKVARLAKIGKQNECGGDKVYAEITSRARFLAATVPEEFWAEGAPIGCALSLLPS